MKLFSVIHDLVNSNGLVALIVAVILTVACLWLIVDVIVKFIQRRRERLNFVNITPAELAGIYRCIGDAQATANAAKDKADSIKIIAIPPIPDYSNKFEIVGRSLGEVKSDIQCLFDKLDLIRNDIQILQTTSTQHSLAISTLQSGFSDVSNQCAATQLKLNDVMGLIERPEWYANVDVSLEQLSEDVAKLSASKKKVMTKKK